MKFSMKEERNNFTFCIAEKFATYLRSNGIEQEIIDLLQGKITQYVFLRDYYRPDLIAAFEKVREVLDTLQVYITKSIIENS